MQNYFEILEGLELLLWIAIPLSAIHAIEKRNETLLAESSVYAFFCLLIWALSIAFFIDFLVTSLSHGIYSEGRQELKELSIDVLFLIFIHLALFLSTKFKSKKNADTLEA